MKALVLSGGRGTRLQPMTLNRSKHLLPVANQPILHYVLQNIADAGITETILVIGENGREIQDYIGDGSRWKLNVNYVCQPEPLGLAHAVQIARAKLADEPFLMHLGDNLLPEGIDVYCRVFTKKRPDALVMVHPVQHPQSFGIAKLEGSRVIRVVEKPVTPPGNLALIGVYIFSPAIHKSIGRIVPSVRGELEITDAIQDLLNHDGRVEAERVQGSWYDTGQTEDLLEANQTMLMKLPRQIRGHIDKFSHITGPVQIGEGTIIVNSRIYGPTTVGENCELYNAFVGPFTAIQDRCRLVDSAVSDSIIMSNCHLETVPQLNRSILGKGTTIKRPAACHPGWSILCADQTSFSLPP